jgi:eukaryotic-like serine/threonine-protein kinase
VNCPTDEALAAWSAGELAGIEKEQIEDHAATCSACRGLVSAVAGVRTRTHGGGIGAEGALIDRYRIIGSAGHGAMGVVLRAHDPVLDREVAIKMINSAAEDPSARARMLAEAQTLARIDHPNVVRVYDAGVAGDEVFLTMAFVEGPTLAQWSGSRTEAKKVLMTVGAGICAVHAVGLVHRDIKPDNIIVSHGEGVLVDLGLAKVLVGGLGSGHAGTENYIAPEIRAGKGASPASDQYAWWRVVEDTLPDPALKEVLARGLAEDPSERFPTLTDAMNAFDRALKPQRRWLYTGGVMVIAAGVALALRGSPAVDACARGAPMQWTIDRPVILSNVAAMHIDPQPLARALDARATRFAALSSETCREQPTNRTHALREELCLEETWNEGARIFPGLATPEPHTVHFAIDDLTLVLPLERCASGVVPAVPAPPTSAQQAEASALQSAIREIHMQRRVPPPKQLAALHALEPRIAALAYAPTTEYLHMTLAEVLHRAGKDDEADRELASVVAMAEAAGDDETRTRALIDVYRQDYLHAAHPAAAASAEAAAARLGNPAITAELELSKGLSDVSRGDNDAALKAFGDAAKLLDGVAIGANAEMVNAAQNLAGVQTGEAALATYDRGLALARARYGLDDPNTLQMRGARATALMYQNKPKDSRPELVAVAAGLQKLIGVTPPVAQAKSYICEVDLALDDRVASRASCDEALEISQQIYPPRDPQLAWPLTLVGHQRVDSGHPDEAIAPLEQALVATTSNTAMPTDRASAQAWLALALAKKDPARAAKLAREARPALQATPSAAALLAKLAGL